MQFEEDDARPADEDPEFTGGLADAVDDDDGFVDDDLPLGDDDTGMLDEEDDDESDLPAADL